MINKTNGIYSDAKIDEANFFQTDPSVLTLEIPNVEEIAKAIWQRQHDSLPLDAISHGVTWRDQAIPYKFWDEFLLDAHAVLLLLHKKHFKCQNARG
jgi:hypothetical protein